MNTTGCATTSGCDVTVSNATVCAGSPRASQWCLQDDYAEQVILNTTAGHPFSGTVAITIYVTAGTVYTGETFYFIDSSGNSRELLTIDFDIGTASSGPATVASVSVVASE